MKKTAFLCFILALILLLSSCTASFVSADDMKKKEDYETKAYLYADSMDMAFCFVTVKNNTDEPVFADGVASGMDEQGNIISASAASINVIGPGETTGCYFMFDGASEIEYVDFSFDYSSEPSCKPVLSTLETGQSISGQDITVTVKNEGRYPAQQLECYVLFLDADGNVSEFSSGFMTPSTTLLTGETAEKTFTASAPFAEAKVFFVGGFYC